LLRISGGRPAIFIGLVIGAVGEIVAAQTVVGRRQPDPGFEVARGMQLDRAAEVALGQAEIGGAGSCFLPRLTVVVRIPCPAVPWDASSGGSPGGAFGMGRSHGRIGCASGEARAAAGFDWVVSDFWNRSPAWSRSRSR
jgi:hypothetical protein